MSSAAGPSLRESLSYQPVELAFGTSGLRGLVADISQLEAYVNSRGFLEYLLRRRRAHRGDPLYCAGDLRPSTDRLVPEQGGRGEILQAVLRAAQDAGLSPEYLGKIPSPALMHFAVRRRAASVMVTGSHIPFERNGIKYNTPAGEVLKNEEAPILAAVGAARAAEYGRPAAESLFDARGMLKPEHRRPLPPAQPQAAEEYLRRYLEAFPPGILRGARVLVWQHSAVGRDLLVQVLQALGAEAVPAGRTDTFLPDRHRGRGPEPAGGRPRRWQTRRPRVGHPSRPWSPPTATGTAPFCWSSRPDACASYPGTCWASWPPTSWARAT